MGKYYSNQSNKSKFSSWLMIPVLLILQAADSRFDVSSLSRSDSASSTQSMQHGGMPELLLGLSYNGTTGRLQVEVIKGSNFKNMAMTRPPGKMLMLSMCLTLCENV